MHVPVFVFKSNQVETMDRRMAHCVITLGLGRYPQEVLDLAGPPPPYTVVTRHSEIKQSSVTYIVPPKRGRGRPRKDEELAA